MTSVSRLEKTVLITCVALFGLSLLVLLRMFYLDSTAFVASSGGTYIEGSVGELQPLNPWFTITNDVNRDIVSLVFAGLLKYNPETKTIEEDLATLSVSDDQRIYTLTLKDNIYWHDHSDQYPHPVTTEDVLYTFETIQDPAFPNQLLRQNYLGVQIDALDDRTVRFLLDEPYSFFPINLTLGLLPKDSFVGVPVSKLDQALDFGFEPVGAGPYSFKSLIQTELSTEVTLERFDRSLPPAYKLKQVVFRIFPDYTTLLSDIRGLDGVRLVPRNENGEPVVPRQFTADHYTLPQYVALFLNLDHDILRDDNLRLGLQLGTDKQAIIDAIGEKLIVDTPLLEIDTSDWRYSYDPDAAQGALFSSDWHLPEKIRLQRLLEIREANDVGALRLDPIVLLSTGAALTVTGSLVDGGSGAVVNEIPVSTDPNNADVWIVNLPTYNQTGSLTLGLNLVQLQRANGDVVDSFYVWRTDSSADFKRAAEEQRLLDLFIRTRSHTLRVDETPISVADLYVEKGFLRRRLSTDPHDIRVNTSGDKLSLKLLTSPSPQQYDVVAQAIKEQWATLGVHVGIEIPESRADFEDALLRRDYDILLFGQSLLSNLDSFPYWHSSGMQKLSGDRNDLRLDAYNLSQYSSLEADALLELIRETDDEDERQTALAELRDVLKADVPAIFLYSPLYTFAYQRNLQGVELGDLSSHSDRFLTLHNWFLKQERAFRPGKGWWSFFGWLPTLFSS